MPGSRGQRHRFSYSGLTTVADTPRPLTPQTGLNCPLEKKGLSAARGPWLVPGSGKEAPKVLPWVQTLIANMKGNIRGIHHGVSPKHLPRYLAEFCYRFNRRFWEPQMFNRMLHACLNSSTITFPELRA